MMLKDERWEKKVQMISNVDPKTSSGGSIFFSRGFSLHRKVFSLHSKRGIGILYVYTSEKDLLVAVEPEPLQSPRFIVG
jgi:hypothetical protein